MNLRRSQGAPRPEPARTTPGPSRAARAFAWPDGRVGPAADPARERTLALATLAMLAVVVATLGTLAV